VTIEIQGVAPDAARALAAIAEREGVLSPSAIKADAANASSPLHRFFTWDDTEAGDRYRTIQAENLIRRVRIVIHQEPERRVKLRAYVSTGFDKGAHSYEPVQTVMADPERREHVLLQIRREAAALRGKLVAFGQYARLVDALDEFLRDEGEEAA
jgi:hypothetical protein